jgi:DNA-binding CsgD family transcriptional regulator
MTRHATDPAACECGNAEAHRRSSLYPLPLCDRCWEIRRARGLEGDPDPVVDRRPDEEGAVGWAFRPPVSTPDLHHDQVIVMDQGRVAMFQQATPVHVRGSRYNTANVRTVPREVSDMEAARILAKQAADALAGLTDKQADVVRLRADGKSIPEVAGELGLTVNAVRERLRAVKARRKSIAR